VPSSSAPALTVQPASCALPSELPSRLNGCSVVPSSACGETTSPSTSPTLTEVFVSVAPTSGGSARPLLT
jgi:hypothetical protein